MKEIFLMVSLMDKATKKKFFFSGLLFTALLLLCACSGALNGYKGQRALPLDRIPLPSEGEQYGVWKTSDLSVYYICSDLPRSLNLSGHVVIAKHIVNSYPRLESFLFQVSFLDENGKVITTRNIGSVYQAYSAVPEKIAFNLESEPLPGTAAIAFSYWGRLRDYGDDASCTYDIGKIPFTKEPESSSEY